MLGVLRSAVRVDGLSALSFFQRVGRDALFRLPDPIYAYIRYFRTHHRLLHLHNPRTFNEKIWYRKIYQRDPRMVPWVDKLQAKELVAGIVGRKHVLPTLWRGTDAADIPFDDLQRPFVLKTNHGACGRNMVFAPDGAVLDADAARRQMDAALAQTYGTYGREWAYSMVPPRVFAEPMMVERDGTVPPDYKFHVFDGQVRFVELHGGRFRDHRVNHYTADWQLLPLELELPNLDGNPQPPARFDEMKHIAGRLAARFDYARVDLYDYRGQVIFGEMTFYPGGGALRFRPFSWDCHYGDAWRLMPV